MNPVFGRPPLIATACKVAACLGVLVWLANLFTIGFDSTPDRDGLHTHVWDCFGTSCFMTPLEHSLLLWVWMICLCLMFVSARLERRAQLQSAPSLVPWKNCW